MQAQLQEQQPSQPQLYLLHIGEIALKGLNRGNFVRQVMTNIKYRLKGLGKFQLYEASSRIYLKILELQSDLAELESRIAKVFGIVSFSEAQNISYKNDDDPLQTLCDSTVTYMAKVLKKVRSCEANSRKGTENSKRPLSFKVETRRINKNFPARSYEISAKLGEVLLEKYGEKLTVDVHNPEIILNVEIRDEIYLYHNAIKGSAGLPSGMSGKGMLLLSGGIDSPVAGYMMASRGMTLDAIYFHAFPYTSDEALQKVRDLALKVAEYSGTIHLHIVDFTEAQTTMRDNCPHDMLTIVMRRMMMRVADKLATEQGAKCLITGESLGQVASQTLEALMTTDVVATKPLFRPLIGVDKNQTIDLARTIGTYDTSILPYEDCCTIFVAKHPKTHPSLADATQAEMHLDVAEMLATQMTKISTEVIKPYKN